MHFRISILNSDRVVLDMAKFNIDVPISIKELFSRLPDILVSNGKSTMAMRLLQIRSDGIKNPRFILDKTNKIEDILNHKNEWEFGCVYSPYFVHIEPINGNISN